MSYVQEIIEILIEEDVYKLTDEWELLRKALAAKIEEIQLEAFQAGENTSIGGERSFTKWKETH